VSSASVTVNVNVASGVAGVAVVVPDGRGVTDRVGVAGGDTEGDGKTTRDGVQSRTARTTTRMTTARSAIRASDATR